MSWFRRKKEDHTEANKAVEKAKHDLAETRERWSEVEAAKVGREPLHDLFAMEIYKMIKERE